MKVKLIFANKVFHCKTKEEEINFIRISLTTTKLVKVKANELHAFDLAIKQIRKKLKQVK